MKMYKVGDSWASVKIIGIDSTEIAEIGTDAAGEEYETGVYATTAAYKFKCECGKVFLIAVEEFPGKYRTRDCGCGIGFGDYAVFVGMSFKHSLRQRLLAYARKENKKVSHIAAEFIERGLNEANEANANGGKMNGGKK